MAVTRAVGATVVKVAARCARHAVRARDRRRRPGRWPPAEAPVGSPRQPGGGQRRRRRASPAASATWTEARVPAVVEHGDRRHPGPRRWSRSAATPSRPRPVATWAARSGRRLVGRHPGLGGGRLRLGRAGLAVEPVTLTATAVTTPATRTTAAADRPPPRPPGATTHVLATRFHPPQPRRQRVTAHVVRRYPCVVDGRLSLGWHGRLAATAQPGVSHSTPSGGRVSVGRPRADRASERPTRLHRAVVADPAAAPLDRRRC